MGLFRKKEAPQGLQTGIIRGSGIVGELPRLGTKELLAGYSLFPWLRAVVDKIADVAGSVDWTASVKAQDGTLRQLPDHPLVNLLDAGNGCHSGLALRKLSFKHYLLAGEFFWLIERNKFGMPIALWPIPPSWVVYAPTFNNDPKAVYRMNFRMWQAVVPATEMIHIYEPDPAMPYGRGTGRGLTLGDELETDEFAARFMKAFFYNSARPDILITAADANTPISKDGAEVLEQKWYQKVGGFMRAHKPFFMSGGPVTVTKLANSTADMQFVDLRKFNRDVVLQMFGLPPETLGILDNSNRATIDAAEFFLTKHCVVPKVKDVRAGLQHRLVPEFDKKVILGFTSPIQIDKEQRIEIMKSTPHAFSIDDIRSAADVEPLPGDKGKVHGVPVNIVLTSIEDAVAAGQAQLSPDADEGSPPTDEPASPDDEKSLVKKELTDDQRRKLKLLLALLDTHPSLLLGMTWATFQARLAQVIQDFGDAEFLSQGSAEKFVLDQNAMAFVRGWLLQRGSLIDGTTGKQLKDLLDEAIASGKSLEELVAVVNAYFDSLEGRESAIVATEVGLAATIAQESAFGQMGIKGKEWLSQRDERVRDTHAQLDGTVVPVTGQFISSSGATAYAPRKFNVPEEDINCRCFLLPATLSGKDADQKTALWKTLDGQLRVQEHIAKQVVARAFAKQRLLVLHALRRK